MKAKVWTYYDIWCNVYVYDITINLNIIIYRIIYMSIKFNIIQRDIMIYDVIIM